MSDTVPTASDPLQENLDWLLAIIPEKDADLELGAIPPEWLNFDPSENCSIQLVFMQLSKENYQLNRAMRDAAQRLILDESQQIQRPARVFISDLLTTPPITKPHKSRTLVRDVMIIWALMILKEMGYTVTKNEGTMHDIMSGSDAVFEYLCLRRGLKFADSAKTIEKIYSRRKERFGQIELGFLIND